MGSTDSQPITSGLQSQESTKTCLKIHKIIEGEFLQFRLNYWTQKERSRAKYLLFTRGQLVKINQLNNVFFSLKKIC